MVLLMSATHAADTYACEQGVAIQHSFGSGASWDLCALVDDEHGLELQNLSYRAPGDTSRLVLNKLHLGQALLHYHDEVDPIALIGTRGFNEQSQQNLDASTCDGEIFESITAKPQLCGVQRDTGLMAKYSNRPGLQGQSWKLFSIAEYDRLTFQIAVTLTEDGRIAPAVSLSGRATRTAENPAHVNAVVDAVKQETIQSTQASLLYTWRMAFALNDSVTNDSVEEFNFKLQPELGNRRPMQVQALQTETLRTVEPDDFRGWRIRDENGSGYYLDPQTSGFNFISNQYNWTQFDFALSTFNSCERHSYLPGQTPDGIVNCGSHIDDYVNGDSMVDQQPVVWFSMSRLFRPSAEDFPIISTLTASFELIPFDWTPTSPFELNGE
jgi:hypothetical protein